MKIGFTVSLSLLSCFTHASEIADFDEVVQARAAELTTIQAVYAVPSDVSAVAGRVVAAQSSLTAVQGWFASQTLDKSYPVFNRVGGKIHVQQVTLDRTASQIDAFSSNEMVSFLHSEEASLTSDSELFVIIEGSQGSGACGYYSSNTVVIPMANCNIYPADNARFPYGMTYLAAHELTHMLGAVRSCAPNYVSGGHLTGDNRDILFTGGARDWDNLMLDPGHDDYYNHNNDCWDIKNSPLLGTWETNASPVTPTSAPSLRPATPTPPTNPNESGGKYCFSGETTVNVKGKGKVRMKNLKIGDLVQVSETAYEPVYSFCKKNHDQWVDMLEISGAGLGQPLELSSTHMLFVERDQSVQSLPALQITKADKLILIDGSLAQVTNIATVRRQGYYAPYTYSGTIAVNGVKASAFATFPYHSSVLQIGSWDTPISFQTWFHWSQAHHRVACKLSWSFCEREEYDEFGMSQTVDVFRPVYQWWMAQNTVIGLLILVPVLFLLAAANVLECTLSVPVTVAVATVSWLWFKKTAKRSKEI